MRIAVLIPKLMHLGPIRVVEYLVNALKNEQDLQITVFYLDDFVKPDVTLTVKTEKFRKKSFCFADFDLVQTNGIRSDLIAFLNRRKIHYHISTIHNFVFEDLYYSYNRLISWIFGFLWLILWYRSDKLVCLTSAMKNYYERWFSSSRLEVINNGIPEFMDTQVADNDIVNVISSFRASGLKIIGTACVLTKRKGIDQVLRLVAAKPDYAFVVIGDGKELTNLKRMTQRLQIFNRCFFSGFRSNAATYFPYFDFVILSSRSEGFGLALIEAVQKRVPVICSDINVFQELFTEEEVTFFRLDDQHSLMNAIDSATKIGRQKTEKAYARYQTHYTDIIMAKGYKSLYQSAQNR